MTNALNLGKDISAILNFKTVAIGLLSIVALSIATFSAAEAHPKYKVCKSRVGVTISFPGRSPFVVSRYLARQKAVNEWKRKTVKRYGKIFSKWRFARAKFIDAENGGRKIYYTVSANPCRSDTIKNAHGHS